MKQKKVRIFNILALTTNTDGFYYNQFLTVDSNMLKIFLMFKHEFIIKYSQMSDSGYTFMVDIKYT